MHGGAMLLLAINMCMYAGIVELATDVTREQFYGGSLSYKVHTKPDGKYMLDIELITGWVIGKGPCGFNCTKADIGRSTKSSRQTMLNAHDPSWFGSFNADYLVNGKTKVKDVHDTVMSNFTEKVLALSMTAGWEQVILKSSFDLLNESDNFDLNYDGHSWKPLPLQAGTSDANKLYWHFQITVSNKLRNDTRKLNNSPHSIARPFYRVNLGQVTPIKIPAVDADGDIIKCQMATFVEGGAIARHSPPFVTIAESCTVYVNASEANGYANDTWIGVPVSVRDYNRETIIYGTEELKPASFSLSQTSVQFLVQVLANLSTPVFVDPTYEGNHNFIMYADTTWRTVIYAEAVMNTTIDEFSTIVIYNENVTLSATQEEGSSRPRVKFATMSWKPIASDVGRHILCAQATDNTGVDTAEMRCFTLDVLADKFNHSTIATPGKPYFVDIPSPEQFVNCKLQATCVVPLYVHGDVEVTEVRIESSRLDESKLGPIELVNHNGVQLYKTDLSFSHSMHGKESICFQAKDKTGVFSEVVCVKSRIEPPDPCVSAPCRNGGSCRRDEDTGGFTCLCFEKFSGKTCEIKDDPCKPDPCVPGQSVMCVGINGILCYCKPGWEGDHCEKSEDDCAKKHITCSGHGTCTDKHRDYECNCFSRYSGKNCEHDNCSSDYIDEFTCPSNGCSPDPCQNDGICSEGGVCLCSHGYSDSHCSTAKCSLSWTVTSVAIIPPTMLDKSQWTCYVDGSTVEPCKLRIYMTTQSGSKPNLLIDTTESLNSIISTGPVEVSSDIPGTSNVFSANLQIDGILKNTEQHYVCVTANEGTMNSSRCFRMNFVQNPYKDAKSNRYPQKDAAVKFIEPTLKDHDRIMCKTSERCSVLLYTSFVSTRSSCQPKTGGVTISSVSPGCDQYDQDNDADDADAAAKASDPCCSQVVSSTTEVNVFKAHPRGPSCISEASFTFTSPGEKEICFQSAKNKTISQQICYTVDVNDPNTDPCSSFPCMNNGHCFHDGHTKFRCICPEHYIGKLCEQGPCQPANNNCKNDAYCQTDSGTNTCICKAGFSGPQCAQDHSSLFTADSLKFTDTATPKTFTCVRIQMCSFALILSGKPASVPRVSAGYVSPSILLEGIDTAERPSVPGSFQANIQLKAKELGMQDLCIQSRDSKGVNKDEVCVKVNVISDVVTIYSFKHIVSCQRKAHSVIWGIYVAKYGTKLIFKYRIERSMFTVIGVDRKGTVNWCNVDRPHFVDPSLLTGSKLECQAGEPCHVLYQTTVGVGNEHECLIVSPKLPTGFSTARLFTSCETCTPGASNNVTCSVDVSIVNAPADIGKSRHICLSLSLKGVNTTGEERCFDLTVTDPAVKRMTGCQRLECQNGGFCDGHIPDSPVCYCPSGFSGQDCATGISSSSALGSHTQTFLGDITFPSEIKCVLGEECTISFQVITANGIVPVVSIGIASPNLAIENPQLHKQSGASSIFKGFAQVHPTMIGTFNVCLQANDVSKTEAEFCVVVNVTGNSTKSVDRNQPYYLVPTTPDGSTVLCQVNKACHLDMHFTKGDVFRFNGLCPRVKDTSTIPLTGIHIFDAVPHMSDCSSDITFQTNSTSIHRLCVTVSLPGKRGETRCYILKIVPDIEKEVLSPCQGKVCKHGGKCLADLSLSPARASCVCSAGYVGIDCSVANFTNVTCSSSICINGGVCVNGICKCPLGFGGEQCERVSNPCNPSPCERGVCYHHQMLFHCLCPAGYTGKRCEKNIDDCSSHPCLNGGNCIDEIQQFTCNCASGFTGRNCETDINECASMPCLNGGFCKDSVNQYFCQCKTGFQGDRCENDPCMQNPCRQGICFTHETDFLCECPPHFTGKFCERSVQLEMTGSAEQFLNVSVGMNFTLNCSSDSLSSQVNYVWSKVQSCDGHIDKFNDSVIHREHVSIGDGGIYECKAKGQDGTAVTHIFHVEITTRQTVDRCNFDDGTLCNWAQYTNDSFDWTFQSGATLTEETGPDNDHTLGTGQGKYLYLESSSPRVFGEYASLVSPLLPANHTLCFEFWYFMYGDGIGRLRLHIQDSCLQKQVELLKIEGEQGNRWIKAARTAQALQVHNDYRLVITADVGSTYKGDIAIDDLTLYDGTCKDNPGNIPLIG